MRIVPLSLLFTLAGCIGGLVAILIFSLMA